MQMNYLIDEKNEAEIEMDNQTVAEIMRVELLKDDSVKFAAWKRTQPGTPVTLAIKTNGKTVKKALKDAAVSVEKQLDKFVNDFEKSMK
ncbi:MAG: RpoL/Rpb11 RNA polymerase subunit family protein [Nanoarchaeota archaeon]